MDSTRNKQCEMFTMFRAKGKEHTSRLLTRIVRTSIAWTRPVLLTLMLAAMAACENTPIAATATTGASDGRAYEHEIGAALEELRENRAQHGVKDAQTLSSLNGLATLYEEHGQYEDAELRYQQALALRREILGEKHPDTLITLNGLANVYMERNRYELAEQSFQETLAIRREVLGEKHPDTLKSSNDLAELYMAQGRYELADSMVNRTLALRTEVLGEQHPDTVLSSCTLANIHVSQGKYELAQQLFEEALAVFRDVLGHKHRYTITTTNDLAILYSYQGRLGLAETMLEQVLSLLVDANRKGHPDYPMTLANLASVYYEQGKYGLAERTYKTGLEAAREVLGEKHLGTGILSNGLAGVYQRQGRYELAEPLLQDDLRMRTELLGDRHLSVAISLSNLAGLYAQQGRYDLAEPMISGAVDVWREVLGEKHPHVLVGAANLADVYIAQGKLALAEPMRKQSVRDFADVWGEKHAYTAVAMDNLAYLYAKQERYDLAEPLHHEVLTLRTEVLGPRHPDTISSVGNLGRVYMKQGRYGEAEEMLNRFLTLSTEELSEEHPKALAALDSLAELHHIMDEDQIAFDLWTTYLERSNAFLQDNLWGASDSTRQSYLALEADFRNRFLSLSLSLKTKGSAAQALNFSLTRKGLLLHIAAQSSALAKASDDSTVVALATELNEAKRSLATLFAARADESTGSNARTIEQQIEKLEADLGRRIGSLGRGQQKVLPADVVRVLTPDQGLLDFHVFSAGGRKTVMAIWVDASAEPPIQLIDLGDFSPIAAAITEYRKALTDPSSWDDEVATLGHELYTHIWGPLKPFVRDKREIFIVPDDLLHLLPFAALRDDSGRHLVEEIRLRVISSARSLVLEPLSVIPQSSVIFAAPLYDPTQLLSYTTDTKPRRSITIRKHPSDLYFGPLNGALDEGKTIALLFDNAGQPHEEYFLNDATEGQLTSVVSPRVLHLATHGFFLEPPNATEDRAEHPLLRAGLALANANLHLGQQHEQVEDGILTAMEALTLRLEGTDLVVLSACESGVGEVNTGEGVYGLQRAFQEAGAKAVLYSLWDIDDEATVFFMKVFYTHFLNGVKPQQALQLTQLEMLDHPTWDLPYYWAGFVLSGRE